MSEVTLDQIEALSNAALIKYGAAPWVAAEVARAVRRAEQTGNVICGLYYLESYCLQLASGRVKGDVEPEVTCVRAGSVKADAKFGFAQAAFARALSNAALIKHGAAPWVAAEVARAVRRAEQTGNVICGLYYLESYCLQLASGRVKGDVEPEVTCVRAGSVKADAKFGFAQAAFARALPQAIEAARDCGTASLAVAHAHTCTSLGFFTEQIAAAGLIGIGFTNASPVVAPPGGNARVIGTNPIAMTVPGSPDPALHFDFSTSAVALGKITMAKAAGESIPLGWAVDADGVPTTDPDAALAGSLVSTGGYKGWGFGLMGEVLAAAVTGSVNSLDVGGLKLPDGAPHGLGQFYMLIDPGTYSDAFDARIARVVDAVSEQPDARIPGAARVEMDRVQVSDALWEKLSALA